LVSYLKEEREWLVFSSKEREFRLRPILAIKMDDFGLMDSFWWVKFRQCVVFFLNLHEMVDLNPKRILISGWLWVLEIIFELLEAMNIFYKMLRMFFWFFQVKICLKWVSFGLKQTSGNLSRDDVSPLFFFKKLLRTNDLLSTF